MDEASVLLERLCQRFVLLWLAARVSNYLRRCHNQMINFDCLEMHGHKVVKCLLIADNLRLILLHHVPLLDLGETWLGSFESQPLVV